MSAEPGAERDVDLARWRGALARRWWVPLAALVAGAIVGGLLTLGGTSVYKAQALLSLGQPFSPGGSFVQSYVTNPLAVSEIVRSEGALKQAAAASGLSLGSLRGKVSTTTVGTAVGPGAARAQPLVALDVLGRDPTRVERAANALAQTVVQRTTASYVNQKIATEKDLLGSTNSQLKSVRLRSRKLSAAISHPGLTFGERLILVSQADFSEQREGALIQQQGALLQQLSFAQNVESAKLIQPAVAVQSTARSRRNSILVGALIGLLLGAIAAIVVDARSARTPAARA